MISTELLDSLKRKALDIEISVSELCRRLLQGVPANEEIILLRKFTELIIHNENNKKCGSIKK